MATIHFETLGCKLNQIEIESLAEAFSVAGFTVESGTSAAQRNQHTEKEIPLICIVNTCTVTGKAEQKARRLIRLLLRIWPEAPVLVTGCYAEVEAQTIANIDPMVRVFPGSRKNELPDLPAFILKNLDSNTKTSIVNILDAFITTEKNTSAPFRLSTDNFHFHSRASIKIQDGCNNSCAYCRIRLARGKSVSLPLDEVILRINEIEQAGWNEVILTGVNLSQYQSQDNDFADLLERILRETKAIRLRISSLYPDRIDEALIPLLENERVCPHFHLSIQSGSDRILSRMRRPYTADIVRRAAENLQRIKENPFLACDIITGFPSETDEDFMQTLSLCTDIGFAGIHAFPFSPRPGTEAFSMKPHIPERIAGERVALLNTLAKKNHSAYQDYWIGRTVSAIVESNSAKAETSVLTENYLTLLIPKSDIPQGSQVRIKITGRTTGKLENKPVELYT